MSKRSREASFSPSAGLTSSSVSVSDGESNGDELEAAHPVKISALSESSRPSAAAMQCSLPPHRHPLDFASVEAFELHYAKHHSNRCLSCGRNFPSPHFLALHIDEHHNPLREELQAKGEKTYSCFVEDCEKKCSTPQKRRLHLIDKHAFPKVYNFRVVDRGIDSSVSMLREANTHRRRVSTTDSPANSVMRRRRASSQPTNNASPAVPEQNGPTHQDEEGSAKAPKPKGARDQQMEELEKSMSALQFVPPSVMRQQVRKAP